MSIREERDKSIADAMSQIERKFGKGSIMRLGGRAILDVPVISTGSLELDRALGTGGLTRGRYVKFSVWNPPGKPLLLFI